MIFSYREGCSGSWLAELLTLTKYRPIYFRQDRQDVDLENIPAEVLHFDGNFDDQCRPARKIFTNQKIVTCHSVNYNLLRELWPDKVIYRLVPKTMIFRSIALAYYKLGAETSNVDSAFQYIKDYYDLHTILDHKPTLPNSFIINFGDLDSAACIENTFNIKLANYQIEFLKDYWLLQYQVQPVDESKLVINISKEQLLTIFNKEINAFNFACYIFVYEMQNNLLEQQRMWTIDDVTTSMSWQELIDLMEYQ